LRSNILRRCSVVLALAALTAPGLAACATRPPANVLLLYYKAGAGDDRKFVECIRPGTSGKYPVDDETFTLRTDARTWNIAHDGEGGDSNTPIESGTKYGPDGQPGPAVKTWSSADFNINVDCTAGKNSPAVRFWEDLGRRYHISRDDTEDGWDEKEWRELLLATFVVAERKAIAEGTRFYTADELDSNGKGQRGELEKRLGPLFQAELRKKLGGDYFCGTGYHVDDQGKPVEVEYDEYIPDGTNDDGTLRFKTEQRKSTCPPVRISITDIDFANAAIAAARADVYAAEQRAKAALVAAQAELEKARKLGEAAKNPDYLKYKQIEAQVAAAEACKSNPNCTVIIDGTGQSGINVGAR